MGSPVSVAIVEIEMQERALVTYRLTLRFWLCDVNDAITALNDDNIDQLTEWLDTI